MRHLLAFAALLALAHVPPARAAAGTPEVYLTWHAPYGDPRARDTLSVACGDSTAADTLYMSFTPGKSSETFIGASATVEFHPLGLDSLGPYWTAERDVPLPHLMKVSMEPGLGYPQPWNVPGGTGTRWDCPGGKARLRMIYAVPVEKGIAVTEGGTLVLARIVLKRPPARFGRCVQPVCIEWVDAALAFDPGPDGTSMIVHQGDHRFVTWNSPGGEACIPLRKAGRIQPWRPKAKP